MPLRARLTRFALALGGLLALGAGPAEAASLFPPEERWKTIVTPHFRVNFPAGSEEVAQLAAGYAEEAHTLLSPYLHSVPSQPTELNLMDNEDTVNGFGFPLPNNQIFIYLTSPSEDQLSSRYDSWLRDILIHEYTHVLHLEKTAGLPAWINGFFGRSYFPHMFQPIFMIEGLAVTTETKYSTGGRGREAAYRMYLRTAALEDKLVSIDKASGYNTIDHPGGELPYVYGQAFYKYLISRYGEDAPTAIADRYAHYPFFGLYGVDETLKEVTGKDSGTLWNELHTWLKQDAEAQKAEILRQGPLTPLSPVTTAGMHHRRPQYMPDGTLTWGGWTGHGYSYLNQRQADGTAKRLISKGPFGHYTYSQDNRYVYHTRNWDSNRFTSYDDIFRYDLKDKKLDRLSERARLAEPAVSPDGRWVVAVQNQRGQTNLVKLRADGTGRKPLTTLTDRTQFGGAVWHPTRHLLAVSAWHDGSRDLFLVDPETGKMRPLWRDRHVDYHPHWTSDGRYLVFSSDRSGVFNLYAYELATGKLFRMTNVLGGLLEPSVRPDLKEVSATSYSLKGYDIVTFPYDPASWAPVPTPASETDIRQALPSAPTDYPVIDYDPWPSLRPKVWAPFGFFDDRGPVLGFTTFGQDSLFRHFLYGAFGYGVISNRPFYSLSYSNDVLLPTINAYAMDTSYAYRPTFQNVSYNYSLRAQYQGVSVTLPGLPSIFLQNNWVTGETLTLGMSLANSSLNAMPSTDAKLEAGAPPPELPKDRAPQLGQTNALSLTYRFGDNYKFAYSVSPEGGNLATLGYERAMPLIGSQSVYDRFWADWRRYVALPWQHHVLAVRASGGASIGDAGGNFYLGGFDSSTLLANVDLRTASGVGQRQLTLRGYPFGVDSGPFAAALSAEYRFPLMSVQRGFRIYPVFVRNVHGAVFLEAGQAWKDRFSWQNSLASVGGELRAQTYFIQAPSEVRVGLGQGLVARGSGIQWPAVYVDVGTYF